MRKLIKAEADVKVVSKEAIFLIGRAAVSAWLGRGLEGVQEERKGEEERRAARALLSETCAYTNQHNTSAHTNAHIYNALHPNNNNTLTTTTP